MSWLQFLFHASLVIQVTANAVVMFCVFPAFKLTKNRAFLFIFFGCLLGTFDTICDHTIGLERMEHTSYVLYRLLRRLTYFADTFLYAAGVVILTRSYLQSFISKKPEATPMA